MTYRGPPRSRKQLGIRPTPQDHIWAHAMSLMGIGVRGLCEKMGERYSLGKPMSRQTLYHHFRQDIVPMKKGRKPNKTWARHILNGKIRATTVDFVEMEIQRMIEQARMIHAKQKPSK